MVSFDFTFRSMFIKEIVEDYGSLWTGERISYLSTNIDSFQGNMVYVVHGVFKTCASILLGAEYFQERRF